MSERSEKVADRARAIHAANGHQKGYQGPCWGALPDEIEQAKREIAAESSGCKVGEVKG